MRVFDFDNTIYDGESPYDFYLFSLKYNPKVVRFVPPLAYYGMRYSKEKCTLEELEHAMAKYLKAYLNSFDDIDGMVSAFWDAHMHKIKHWYHPQPGDVIMTGSFDYTMNEIQRRLGIKTMLCSTVNRDTLELEHLNFGTNKVKVFREMFGPDVVPDEFYSDNMIDLPMMKLARRAYLVHGNHIKQVNV